MIRLDRWGLFAILALMCVVVGNAQRQRVLDDSVPPAAEAVTLPDSTTVFLLAAFGDSNIATPGLTDVLMLVAVDSAAGSVSMLHVPRDLWVNIPGFGMDKINSAYYLGETHAVEGGGLATLHQTIVYNFGFDFDHYAMMDFTGFLGVIDQLGGVRVAVDCVIRDWKLVDRYADKTVEENYAMFTLPFGVHTLDADTALWYVRSRKTSSDLDRGRRQQDVLRAIWRTVRENGLIENLPTLWDATSRYVVTDLTLADALGYAPLAASLDANAIEQYRFEGGDHFSNALGPAPEYRAVLEPKWEAIHDLVGDFLTPPTPNQSALRGLRVQVVNAGGINGLATVAADRLAQAGLNPEIITEATHYREFTAIYDYTGQTKGSPIAAMQDLFRTTSDGVVVEPDPNRTVDYKIYVGASYQGWACDRPVIQPEWPPAEATPTP